MKAIPLLLTLLITLLPTTIAARWPIIADLGVPFDESFGKQNYDEITWCFRSSLEPQWYKRLKDRYECCKPTKRIASVQPLIPKIIHQIWLGSPFPEKYRAWQRSWVENHPEWEYKLWTDAEVAQLTLKNQALYEKATNYGQKSDILRYELLLQFGGLYVDVDCECIMPFDELHHRYRFYGGLCSGVGVFDIGSTPIACTPGHPIMQACVDNLTLDFVHEYIVTQVAASSGPGHFTAQVMGLEGHMGEDMIIFPCSYLLPLPYNKRLDWKKKDYLRPETFAIHHWGASWVPTSHYPKGRCRCEDCKVKMQKVGAELREKAKRRYALLGPEQK